MSAKLILTVHDSVTAHQLSLFSVYFKKYSQGAPQIVTAAAVVKLRHTLRHSTCVSTGFGIIGRHKILCVARMLGNTEGTFARILRDLGFASTRPVVRNIRAPLDIIRPVLAKRPHWRPFCLSQEKVSGNVLLLNLLQFSRDLAQHTRPVVPVLCDENIHYRICKMMYGEKTTGWNVRLFLRSHPILYGFWHAYKFCVTQTFRSFWPIMTFFRKDLLRSGDTVPCFPKLITMEITVGALLLGMGPHIRRLNRKCHSLGLARPVNWRGRLRYAVCKAIQVLLTQYCPMLLYLGHLVR